MGYISSFSLLKSRVVYLCKKVYSNQEGFSIEDVIIIKKKYLTQDLVFKRDTNKPILPYPQN